MCYIPSPEQRVDVLTKVLPTSQYVFLCKKLSFIIIPLSLRGNLSISRNVSAIHCNDPSVGASGSASAKPSDQQGNQAEVDESTRVAMSVASKASARQKENFIQCNH